MTPTTSDLPGTYLSTVPLLDPPTVRAAALTVAEHATTPTELRTFLAQLGLCGQTLTPSTTALLDCGHPVTDGYRHPNQGGIICRACAARRDYREVSDADRAERDVEREAAALVRDEARAARDQRIREMRAQGATLRHIRMALGVGDGTVHRALRGAA